MHEEVIAHIRGRIKRIRRIIELAHDPEMIASLKDMVGEAEEDVRKLEADERKPQSE